MGSCVTVLSAIEEAQGLCCDMATPWYLPGAFRGAGDGGQESSAAPFTGSLEERALRPQEFNLLIIKIVSLVIILES